MKKIKYPNLVAEMARHGESEKTLAELLDLHKNSISKRFLGKVDWTISDIDKICEHYGKDYYELFKKND